MFAFLLQNLAFEPLGTGDRAVILIADANA